MPKNKASSNRDAVSVDLLFQLTYLSTIAAAGIPRSRIFQMASGLPNTIAPHFEKIHVLAEKMHYDYTEACRMVGQAIQDTRIKSLLLRISSSLIAGEAESDFLEREAKAQAETYSNEYEGKVEVLRKYTDAYTAITISAALVLVVAVVSMLIYNTSSAFIMGLVVVSVGVTGVGVWILYKVAPKESKVLDSKEGPPKARLLAKLFPICVSTSFVLPALLSVRGLPIGVLLLVAAFPLIPLGLVANSYDRDIDSKDKEISTFLRALGSVATAIGSTLTEAMERLDLRSFAALGPHIKQLHDRLVTRIDPALCWRRMVTDSGSGLIDRSVAIFQDAINQGGDAGEVGARSSLMAQKVSTLRERRRIVSVAFGWLTLVMHATITALLVFIVSIVDVFSGMLSGVDMGGVKGMLPFFSFSSADVQMLRFILIPTLILFSLANAFAPLVTDGGHKYRFFFFVGITLAIAGANLLGVPAAVKMLFNFSSIN
ncbi:MAG: archaellar assembly protein FlaJ [Chloroflexi bacterium]|nr:archaellar assembly protein FlaJ [Chloroflexota bacterium]